MSLNQIIFITQMVNISKIVDYPVNIAVALSHLRAVKLGRKIDGCAYYKFVFSNLTFYSKTKMEPPKNVLLILQKMKLENSL